MRHWKNKGKARRSAGEARRSEEKRGKARKAIMAVRRSEEKGGKSRRSARSNNGSTEIRLGMIFSNGAVNAGVERGRGKSSCNELPALTR